MGGIMSKDCPAGTTPKEDFDKTDIVCPVRDHAVEKLAIEKALGPNPDTNNGIPSLKSLGIRAVRVSLTYACISNVLTNK
jgi:hypothetical protein